MPVTSFAVSKIEQVGKIKIFIQQVKNLSEIFPGHYWWWELPRPKLRPCRYWDGRKSWSNFEEGKLWRKSLWGGGYLHYLQLWNWRNCRHWRDFLKSLICYLLLSKCLQCQCYHHCKKNNSIKSIYSWKCWAFYATQEEWTWKIWAAEPSSTGLYLALLGCTRLYWDVLGCTRLYWAVLGCTGMY